MSTGIQRKHQIAHRHITRPAPQSGDASEALTEHQLAIQQLYQRLAGDISLDRSDRTEEQQGRWLLANMLDWYRRESKATWWEYFRLCDLQDDELLDEKAALAGLKFTGHNMPVKKSFVHRYQYPP